MEHRLVYQVLDDIKTIKILRMWTHSNDSARGELRFGSGCTPDEMGVPVGWLAIRKMN